MKNDINLLLKRKTKQFSSKRFATAMIALVFIGGALFAGITLPAQALSTIKLSVADLDYELVQSSHIEQDLIDKRAYFATLNSQLESLEALDSTKSDVLGYIETIERCLPTEANLTQLSLADDQLYIIGVAKNDAIVATFDLRLRESGMFNDVFITSSTLMRKDMTSFTMTATLPFPLSQSDITDTGSEQAQDANNAQGGE